MKKNDELIVTIDDIGINMEGIAHEGGQTLFVPFALPQEKVKIRVINTKSNNYICKVVDVITPSPYRVQAICPYFTKCGGCDCLHVDYCQQLVIKRKLVAKTLSKMIGEVSVNPLVASPNYRYRNKMAFPVVQTLDGVSVGMYRVASHKVIALNDCIISQDFVSKLLKTTCEYINKHDITGYNEADCSGMLRHIVARQSDGQLLITLVSTTDVLPGIDDYVEMLKTQFDNFSVSININKSKTNVIFGDKFVRVYGKDYIACSSHGINYPVSAYSFMQVNDYIREKIYDYVLSAVGVEDYVVDAYSGAGLLTAMVAKNCKQAYGIEIVASAVDNANQLVADNHINNVCNILGDCAIELPKLLKKINGKIVLILDPPRKGCDENLMHKICEQKSIGRIVYISCNPATLARDLKILGAKYNIESVQPFDMFPNTKHVETVVVLNAI